MASRYSDLVNAVLDGDTVEVPFSPGVSSGGIRTAIWRELKQLKTMESQLGVTTELQRKQISIQEMESCYVVKLIIPKTPTVTFRILPKQEGS